MSTDPTKETHYTLGAEEGPQGNSKRQGHLCCGGCCDMRRAVIIMNIVNAALVAMGLMGVLAAKNLVDTDAIQDDEVAAVLGGEDGSLPFGWLVASSVIRLILAGFAIYGAIKYNYILVIIGALSYVYEVVLSLWGLNFIGLLYPALFLYPHIFLVKEIRSGIMTALNYPNEKHSCCCV